MKTTTLFVIQHGWWPTLTILDGAASNQASIKRLVDSEFDPDDAWNYRPVATNFCGIRKLDMWFMVCSAHEMKNLVNALHHSQPNGTRGFDYDPLVPGNKFGWLPIISAYDLDNANAARQLMRKCPGLTKDVVERPGFFKLNVGGALAVTRGDVASAIRSQKVIGWEHTADFLDALGKLFTFGLMFKRMSISAASSIFLGLNSASAPPSTTAATQLDPPEEGEEDDLAPDSDETSVADKMGALETGFTFFATWRANVRAAAASGNYTADDLDLFFLSHVTWHLLACTVNGFRGFCKDFFARRASEQSSKSFMFRIYPIRLTGSALELLFCIVRQMRGVKGGLTHKQFQINLAAHRMSQLHRTASKSPYRAGLQPDNAEDLDLSSESSSLTPMHKHRAAQVVLGDLNPNIAHTSLLKKKKSNTLASASKVPRSSPRSPSKRPGPGPCTDKENTTLPSQDL